MRKIASIKLPCQTWYGKKTLNMTLTVQIPHPAEQRSNSLLTEYK